MKYLLKKQFRDFKKAIFLNISVFLITLIGIFLFSGLNSTGHSINDGVKKFYSEQNLADYTVTHKLDGAKELRFGISADAAMEFEPVTLKIGEINRTAVISLFPFADFEVNKPYLVRGAMPVHSFEALIDVAFADANGVKTGDEFTVNIEGQPQRIKIVGLAIFPDHLYKGELIPQVAETAIIKAFVDLPEMQVNTLYISSDLKEDELRTELRMLTGQSFANSRIIRSDKNLSVARVETDLRLILSLMNILPTVCLIALCLILYVNMSKRIEDESYNIGVMCACGIPKRKIIFAYMLPYFALVTFAGIIGIVIAIVFMPNIYVSVLTKFYTLPSIPPSGIVFSVVIPIVTLMAITALSLLFALISVMKKTPNELMRGKTRSSVKMIKTNKIPLAAKLSLRNFIAYKQKAIITILSCGLCLGLLLTAFVLDDSVINLRDTVYEKCYNYDVTIDWNTGDDVNYFDVRDEMINSGLFGDVKYCLEFPSTVTEIGKDVMVAIIDGDNPCYTLYDNGNKIEFGEEGVYIPKKLGLDVVSLTIYVDDPFVLDELPVAGTFDDIGIFGVIIPLKTLEKYKKNAYNIIMSGEFNSKVYATRKAEGQSEFVDYLQNKYNAAFLYEVHGADTNRFDMLFAVLNITIALLFAVCGTMMILLILNISCLSMRERIADYSVFKALGLRKKVNVYSSLENYISLFFAFLLSVPIGLTISRSIIKAVARITSVAISVHLFAWSLPVLFLGGALFTAIGNVVINKKISKVDIVKTLKNKE